MEPALKSDHILCWPLIPSLWPSRYKVYYKAATDSSYCSCLRPDRVLLSTQEHSVSFIASLWRMQSDQCSWKWMVFSCCWFHFWGWTQHSRKRGINSPGWMRAECSQHFTLWRLKQTLKIKCGTWKVVSKYLTENYQWNSVLFLFLGCQQYLVNFPRESLLSTTWLRHCSFLTPLFCSRFTFASGAVWCC